MTNGQFIQLRDTALALVTEHEWSEIPSLSVEDGRHAIRWMLTADAAHPEFTNRNRELLSAIFPQMELVISTWRCLSVEHEAAWITQAAIKRVFVSAHPELAGKLRAPMVTKFRCIEGLVTQPYADQWHIPNTWWDKAATN